MLSKLTLMGLHNWTDGKIWDNLQLPEEANRQVFINECLRLASEFSVLYADPDYMKTQIGFWSLKWQHSFERWLAVTNEDYDPLYNVDVKTTFDEFGHNEGTGSETGNSNFTDTTTDDKTIQNYEKHYIRNDGYTELGGENNVTHSKAAYDSNTFQNTEKTNEKPETTTTTWSTDDGNSNYTNTTNDSIVEQNYANNSKSTSNDADHEIHTTEVKQGNQGVTQSQEMLLAEYNAWKLNIYTQMAEIFVNEFCICVYN